MNNVAAVYNFSSDNCYPNSQALEIAIWDNEVHTIVGVQFNDTLSGRNDIDENLYVTMRYVNAN